MAREHHPPSLPPDWEQIDWNALRKLRERFLAFDTAPGGDDYWHSERELASYDLTFAERIGWKWDTVLDELRLRGWAPPSGDFLDWGCGSGIAGRRVISAWPEAPSRLFLSDRSRRATSFATARARQAFPHLKVEPLTPGALPPADQAPGVLILSHVLNELSPASTVLERLLTLATRATTILWVEPGTSATSRRLVEIRERLLPHFRPVAPCPHAERCDLLSARNERHWCHHFARIPREIFQHPGWGRFARQMEIDLSTLPFSVLVLDKRPVTEQGGNARIIGEPRMYKGFAKALACQAGSVDEVIVQKRDAPELFKAFRKNPGSLYEWERTGEKITGGDAIF